MLRQHLRKATKQMQRIVEAPDEAPRERAALAITDIVSALGEAERLKEVAENGHQE
jgi:hypothetical protein